MGAGAALNLAGAMLRFAPTPQTLAIGAGLSLLGAILVMLGWGVRTASKASISMPSLSGMGGVSGGGGAGTGGSSGCAPDRLTAVPEARGWLRVLLPLQLLLGFLLLRRRREERGT
jgi:hypothetical protein